MSLTYGGGGTAGRADFARRDARFEFWRMPRRASLSPPTALSTPWEATAA